MGAHISPVGPRTWRVSRNIVQAMLAYQAGELGTPLVPLNTVDRIIAIGSDRDDGGGESGAARRARAILKPSHVGIGSINCRCSA